MILVRLRGLCLVHSIHPVWPPLAILELLPVSVKSFWLCIDSSNNLISLLFVLEQRAHFFLEMIAIAVVINKIKG